MKTKKLVKKLRVNKRNIANLNNLEMNAIDGGWSGNTCPGACYTVGTCPISECGPCPYPI